jgi:hypothetical protein
MRGDIIYWLIAGGLTLLILVFFLVCINGFTQAMHGVL